MFYDIFINGEFFRRGLNECDYHVIEILSLKYHARILKRPNFQEYYICIERKHINDFCFLYCLYEISNKYNKSLSHEDAHGAFIIDDFSIGNLLWVFDCYKL